MQSTSPMSLWPADRSFDAFRRLFNVRFHSMVFDLSKGVIEPESGDWEMGDEEKLDGDDVDPELR